MTGPDLQGRTGSNKATGLETVDLDGVVGVRESLRVMRAYFGQYFISYIALSLLVTVVLFLLLAPTDANSGGIGFLLAQPAPLRLAVGFAAFGAIIVLALIVLSWFQFIPRQLAMIWPAVVSMISALVNTYGIAVASEPLRQGLAMAFGENVLTAAAAWVICIAIAIAALALGVAWSINAWRLLLAPRNDFLAARGWRAPGYAPGSAIRRMLGVPTYASALSRARLTVTLFFLLAGVLGAGAALLPFLAPAWISRHLTSAARFLDPYDAASGVIYLGFVAGGIIGPFLLLHFLALLGRLVMRAAQRMAAHHYQGIREWDDRAPILYLRSFAIDNETVRVAPREWIARLIGLGARFATVDETVLDCAAPYGPVVAIGDPRDPIPPLGAARTFVRGDDWQSVVTDLASAARFIVLVTDASAGVRWEVDHVLGNPGIRAKTLFLASPSRSRDEHHVAFGQVTRSLGFAHALPDNVIALSPTAEGGLEALTSPTLSSDAYACALNSRLMQQFGRAADFPSRRSMGARVVAASVWAAVAGAGAAVIAMLVLGNWNSLSAALVQWTDRPAPEEEIVSAEAPALPRAVREFDDCDGGAWCPRMVEVPAGSFDDHHRAPEGGRIDIAGFAVGKYKVTRGQWAAFVNETGRADPALDNVSQCTWRHPGFAQNETDPVVCVNWNDAQDYVRWLSERTGHTYRLLTDAEWEYVARQGELGYYSTNSFALLDIVADPREWVQDCEPELIETEEGLAFPSGSLAYASDASAREEGNCARRLMRSGGTYLEAPYWGLFESHRGSSFLEVRGAWTGLRVARTS